LLSLGFGLVLGDVLPGGVCAEFRVEEHHIHGARGEGGEVEVVRHHPLVIRGVSSSVRGSLGLFVELLVRLLGPREEEAAAAVVGKAVP
jgi:hypothetical protein